jgi:outer membrane lipoprotein-sorting protein
MATLRRRVARVAAAVAVAIAAVALPLQLPFPGFVIPLAYGATASEAAGSAQSAGLVSQIAAQLGHASGIRARFAQTQTRAALKQPLVSSGTLLLMRERGIIWHIETPYQATYLITDSGATEIDAAGHRVSSSGASSRGTSGARGVAQVSRMMRAMLGGDLSALYSQFDVQATGTPAQWRMRLTPNQPQLAQAIKSLQMSGSSYLQSLRITLASGDVTTLDFADTTAVTELTPAEQQLFGAP